jgi:8-oxo-dGTP pyrophosphatase MutT (NUDIX family)
MRAIRYQAAGGVVVDAGQVLVLRRDSRDEMRLPKGHIEPGESAQETALREVQEESGYGRLEVLADLGHQTVEFDYRGTHVVRDEHYFLMGLCGSRADRHKPEKQFRPEWLNCEQALNVLSYQAEREWVRRAKDALDKIS